MALFKPFYQSFWFYAAILWAGITVYTWQRIPDLLVTLLSMLPHSNAVVLTTFIMLHSFTFFSFYCAGMFFFNLCKTRKQRRNEEFVGVA